MGGGGEGVVVKAPGRILDRRKGFREKRRKIWMKNILENQAKPGPSIHVGLTLHTAPPSTARAWISILASGEAKTEDAPGEVRAASAPGRLDL